MRHLDDRQTVAALHDYGLDRPSGPAFAFRDMALNTFYDWHDHPYHQLIYATGGITLIETAGARYLLPAGRAAWIPAGTMHRTGVSDHEGASLYFEPASIADPGDRLRILVATPVMREMILHAMRWPQGAAGTDRLAASFFATLALMCGEWLESELPLSLPGAAHPGLARAMDDALADLAAASQEKAWAAAGMSERSFRRHFLAETGMSWQAWVGQARGLSAMTLLATGARVTDVAIEVGYGSMSAFAKAFRQLSGESPADYRRRITAPPAAN
jgi:AraC-like DNA-binding protein